MATLEEYAVAEVLSGEKSVIDFEQELSAMFDVSMFEIISIIRALFQRYAIDGRVSFATLRRYLTAKDWATFSNVIKSWKRDEISEGFRRELDRLLQRKKVSVLDELNYSVQHSIDKRATRESRLFLTLLGINIVAAYYTRLWGIGKAGAYGVKLSSIDDSTVRELALARWQATSNYDNFEGRIEAAAELLVQEYEFMYRQAIASSTKSATLESLVSARMNKALSRERSLVRTEMSRAMSAADVQAYKDAGIDSYRYVAILDNRTTEICWSLHGKEFKVSQAQEQVNLPPMHVNCRSSTEPVYDYEETEEELTKVSRTQTLEQFIEENYEGEYLDEVLDFVASYHSA